MASSAAQANPSACTGPCCGAPVPLRERTPCHFPDHYWNFPRSYNNAELPLVHPPIPQGQYRRKVVHASKTASIKWKNAFTTGTIGNLDNVDFALAVFDMAEQLKSWIPKMGRHMGFRYATPEAWRKATDQLILDSYEIASETVRKAFPGYTIPTFDYVMSFAHNAMDWVWNKDEDSRGMVEAQPFDEAYWTDRYVIPLRYAQLCLFVYPFGNDDLDLSDPDRLAKTAYEVVDGRRDYVATVIGRDKVMPFLRAEVKRRKEALERQIRVEGVALADDNSTTVKQLVPLRRE